MLGFIQPSTLRRHGVLGINQRNTDFIMRYNPRNLYPLVDDKLQTKKLAIKAGIAVPELYATIEINNQIKQLGELLNKNSEVVIKPANGSQGNGILVLSRKIGNRFKTASGEIVSLNSIKHYVSNILSGMYSLSGLTDKAFLEYRVQFDPIFDDISFKGVPDIRIIVFKGIPVAAMLRLPTSKSNGKANLHQGAIGVGIDIATGVTTHAVIGNTNIKFHPDTEQAISDREIPNWEKILTIAITCAETVGLGYLGIDIVLDRKLGPLMLELNARPGLNVQLANQQGLLKRLETIEQTEKLPKTLEQCLAFSRTLN